MTNYVKDSLLEIANGWPLDHLNSYITQLEDQITGIKQLLIELKAIQRAKQKKVDRQLRDSGTRGGK